MKQRRIAGPPMGKSLLESRGRGPTQPQPQPRPGPAPPTLKPGESSPGHQSQSDFQFIINQVTKSISDALGSTMQSAANSVIGPGEVLLGVVLIMVGLLLATGQMGKVARGAGQVGLFAATRGALK